MMALNKFMHPRNPYKDSKPNFKELSEKYEEFREHVTVDDHGRYHIDFKKPECLRALSWVLLKENFGLDVLMPLDRLIPTVPLRINYILWLEDILDQNADGMCGIDIGTGSSCIYPMLGAKKNSWNFLATETDARNYNYAKKNVEDNQLADKVKVVQVADTSTLFDVLSDNEATYDFCMCNPPFFGSNFEAWGMLTSRTTDRPDPSSVSTASPVESIVAGGEVEFVKRMINDSVALKGRIRVYTTMLGKKSSLAVLKDELKRNGVTNVSHTEFCQGKTMRWGLGWSFEGSISFPKSPSKALRSEKPKPPLTYHIPHQGQDYYSLDGVTQKILNFLKDLQIDVTYKKKFKKTHSFTITSLKNTWSNQRKKRRQQQKSHACTTSDRTPVTGLSESQHSAQQDVCTMEQPKLSFEKSMDDKGHQESQGRRCDLGEDHVDGQSQGEADKDRLRAMACNDNSLEIVDCKDFSEKEHKRKVDDNNDHHEAESKICRLDEIEPMTDNSVTLCDTASGENFDKTTSDIICQNYPGNSETDTAEMESNKLSVVECSSSAMAQEALEPVLCCKVSLRAKSDDDIVLEMSWISGKNREAMHQVLQYFKNRLQ